MPFPKTDQWAYFGRMMASGPADECWRWPFGLDRKGYAIAGRALRLARVSCEAEHGPAPEGAQACHSCRDRSCFNPRHLRWGDCHDQAADRLAADTYTRGEQHHAAILTETEVRSMRRRYDAGFTAAQLAADYGITATHVRRIVDRKSWTHVY